MLPNLPSLFLHSYFPHLASPTKSYRHQEHYPKHSTPGGLPIIPREKRVCSPAVLSPFLTQAKCLFLSLWGGFFGLSPPESAL